MSKQQNSSNLSFEHSLDIINRNQSIFYSYDSHFVYHYCTLETCNKIIQNQNLWASDIRFMNDPQEFNYGIDLIKEILAKKKELFCDDALPLLNAFEEKLNNIICFDVHICVVFFSFPDCFYFIYYKK